MDTMGERISILIKYLGLTKTDFAAKINLSKSYMAMICSGDRIPSNRTILDICRVFDVSESWLRTGEGEMMVPRTREQEERPISLRAGAIGLARIAELFADMDDRQWANLKRKIYELIGDGSDE